MAHIPGTAVKVYYNTGSYAVPVQTAVGDEISCTLDISVAIIDTTNKDSGGWKEGLASIKTWTTGGTANYDEGDAAQVKIEADVLAGTLSKVEVKTLHSKKFYGDVNLTSYGFSAAHDGIVTLSYALEGTGELSHGAA